MRRREIKAWAAETISDDWLEVIRSLRNGTRFNQEAAHPPGTDR